MNKLRLKKRVLIMILPLLSLAVFAQEKPKSKLAYSGFSGGMMVHTGFVQSGEFSLKNDDGTLAKTMRFSGAAFGIGGQARVHLGKHLRVGTEGYVSDYFYENKSYTSLGWGGLLADCAWEIKRFTLFAGGTFGGGAQKNLTILKKPADGYEGFDLDDKISYRKYSFLCAVPFAGAEFALTKKIHLVLKVDYIFNISNPQPDFNTGTRIYFGFSFCR